MFRYGGVLFVALTGCTALNPMFDNGGGSDGTDAGSAGAGETSSGVGASATVPSGSGAGGTSSESGEPEPFCGDGHPDPDEACDDGVNDGAYGGCMPGCGAKAAFCGDELVQEDAGEECDDGANEDSADGCLRSCNEPHSCLEILAVDPTAEDGDYRISPDGNLGLTFTVYCDMTTDGGGYTFAVNNVAEGAVDSAEAEAVCATQGMQLWIPRTEAHLDAAWDFAEELGGAPPYLRIFGVYPAFPEAACGSMPFNSDNPECDWEASDVAPFWIHGTGDHSEPNGSGLLDQSVIVEWTPSGEIAFIDDLINSDLATAFFCDVGDKWGP